jgi:hypothetical protein
MLEHVFGSRTRVKLMNIFLHHPEEMFFVRELTRTINTQINAVRREIQNLVKVGMIVEGVAKDDDGVKRPGLKRKYYQANKNFPLMQEVRALLTKAHVLMEWKLDEQIRELGDVRYLAFMGVFMGQRNQPVDILVVGDVDKIALKRLINQVEKDLGIEINYTSLPYKEFMYRMEMADRFLRGVMDAPKTVAVDTLELREKP